MVIPIILFAYNRPGHLRRALDCLRENRVPLIYAFSDGPRTPDKISTVAEARRILHAVDWCDMVLCERKTNLGLGRSILTGVTEVLAKHEAAIVFEDDLVCVPGTYDYLCAAMEHYQDDPRVMSVTGWTHPTVTPDDMVDQPYFDGRSECWVWGTWARAWRGMEQDAKTLMQKCKACGIDVYRYGTDLPAMAEVEAQENIWAVRFLYWHILNRGLCLRPPWSMVEHAGFDAQGTHAANAANVSDAVKWADLPLRPCPPLPRVWPFPVENLECPHLWRKACGARPSWIERAAGKAKRLIKLITPPIFINLVRSLRANKESFIEWEYIPEGWNYAKIHPEVKGWSVQDILEVYKQKWPKFVAMVKGAGPLGVTHESDLTTNEDVCSHNTIMTFAYALTLAAHKKDRVSILDWGGGIGHYYLLAKSLLPGVEIDYCCKDLPILCEYGKKLLPVAQFFVSDSECAGRKFDLVLASSSLHYAENWQQTLRHLISITAGYLFITRLPVVLNSAPYVAIQRAYKYDYNTEYLFWCINREELISVAVEGNMELMREFIIGEYPDIVNAPAPCYSRGYLFRLKENI